MSEYSFETPVLFLIFNRPDNEQLVFDQIKLVKPKKLYVGADGPRENKVGEDELCKQAREIIKQVDWDCELHTLFRDKNLGCANAISSAISWFFENEDMGIILEDDCVPHVDFFSYCDELLKKYYDDESVMIISGDNAFADQINMHESYYFSKYIHAWGWATWKRVWKLYDMQMTHLDEVRSKLLCSPDYQNLPEFIELKLFSFQTVYENRLHPDTWDWQLLYTILLNDGLCVTPSKNLVSNIGVNGAHYSSDSWELSIPTKGFENKIVHPKSVFVNDSIEYNNISLEYDMIDSNTKMILKITVFLRRIKLLAKRTNLSPLRNWYRLLTIKEKINRIHSLK